MSNDIQIRMLSAVYACLLPVARLLLRFGVTYRQFDAVAKRAFVREALAATDIRGRGANTSRVAAMTGLSRKDVKRLREILAEPTSPWSGTDTDQWGPPARVLHAWHVDEQFLDEQGMPRRLRFQDDERGFAAIVRAVAGDIPPGAVRAELRRCAAILEFPDGSMQPIKRYYVPGDVDEKAIAVTSGMLFPMASGIAHNTDPSRTTDGFIQRFAFSDAISPRAIPEFRQWSRQEATMFIERIDDWLAMHESTRSSNVSPPESPTVGMGVFYYEGPSADQAVRNAKSS